jgi:transcriptional regulator with XRE-family HTH domain
LTDRDLRFDGHFMQLIRKRARMTFAALAQRTGTRDAHLSDIENHKSDPSFSLAVRIGEALNVGVQYFVIPTPGRPQPTPKARGRAP